jgi:hypothetical protein
MQAFWLFERSGQLSKIGRFLVRLRLVFDGGLVFIAVAIVVILFVVIVLVAVSTGSSSSESVVNSNNH